MRKNNDETANNHLQNTIGTKENNKIQKNHKIPKDHSNSQVAYILRNPCLKRQNRTQSTIQKTKD